MSVTDFLSKASKTLKKKDEVLEVDIEKDFCDFAKTLKCWSVKLNLFMGRGWPDRSVFCPGGLIIFFEFKRNKAAANKKRQIKQKEIEKRLKSLGFKYFRVDTKGQAEKLLVEFLTKTN